jgi:inosose dehydratase
MENGGREYRHNLKATQPDAVGFCYDVHWVFRGGVSPQEALKEFGGRIVSWHLRQSREGVWWEDLAPGDIDYSWIASQARARSLAPVYTVELALESGTKITRSVVANHQRSREFVKSVFKA